MKILAIPRQFHQIHETSTKIPPILRKIHENSIKSVSVFNIPNPVFSIPNPVFNVPNLVFNVPNPVRLGRRASGPPGTLFFYFFQFFLSIQNVQKPKKLTFPESQTSQRLTELTKNYFFDEFSKNSKCREIGCRLSHSMRNCINKNF